MKIYKKYQDYSQLIGHQCDNWDCRMYVLGEDLPKGWIEESGKHYCSDCQIECYSCHRIYSIDYLEYWMTEGLCEDCFTNLKEDEE